MQKILIAAAFAAVAGFAGMASAQETANTPTATPAAAVNVAPERGQRIFASNGVVLGRVARVEDDGAVKVIFDSRLITIPANTLSMDGDRLTTSLSRREVAGL